MMGGRSIYYCGGCGEEMFDNMECQICGHPYVAALRARLALAEKVAEAAGKIVDEHARGVRRAFEANRGAGDDCLCQLCAALASWKEGG